MTLYTATTAATMQSPGLPILDLLARHAFPGNAFRLGSQNYRLYERLKEGEVTNAEIVRSMGIFNSTGRIDNIRKRLHGTGWEVKARPVNDNGMWVYSLRRIGG